MPSRPAQPPLTVSNPALISDGGDGAFRQMLHNLLAFSVRLEQIRSDFGARIGLSGPQYTILITIRQLGESGDVGVGRVADHLALTPTFVTNETKKLTRLGVIDKRPDPDDLRRVKLTVTEAGEALLRQLAPVQQQINDQLFAPIDAARFPVLQALAAELRLSAEQALRLSDQLATAEEGAA
ncbi:MAG: MarR family winged helix-turn-helix transcriptional regulator [Pseudodonghicola sp.]